MPRAFLFLDQGDAEGKELSRVFIRVANPEQVSERTFQAVAVVVSDIETLRAVKSIRKEEDLTPIFAEANSFEQAIELFRHGVDGSILRFRVNEQQIIALSDALIDGIATVASVDSNSEKLGIVAMQGEFRLQAQRFREAIERNRDQLPRPVTTKFVTQPEHLQDCRAVVLVGGWSNLQTKLMQSRNLVEPLMRFKQEGGFVLGLCAGMILCRSEDGKVCEDRLKLGFVDMRINNNELNNEIETRLTEHTPQRFRSSNEWIPKHQIPVFSEGPVIVEHGNEVQPLAITAKGDIVGAKQGRVMVMAYHNGPTVHDMFLELMSETWT